MFRLVWASLSVTFAASYGLILSMSVANSTNPPRFSTVAIIGKHGEFGASSNTLGELADFLEHRGHRVVFEAATAQDLQRSTLVSMMWPL